MKLPERISMPPSREPHDPASLLAAKAALDAIGEAVRTAGTTKTAGAAGSARASRPEPSSEDGQAAADQALAALVLLRELREQLAGWEPGLIEAARAAGSSWAELAQPLGVASRQAAERRYLRVRPGTSGSTGEQRVQAIRDHRAADRSVSAWARTNAAELRQLAGQITALTDLPAQAHTPLARLADALAADDATHLIGPLTETHTHLEAGHPDLAARVDSISHHTDRLRQSRGGRGSRGGLDGPDGLDGTSS
ncbi:type III effector protein [Streptomyces tauricus]|uniref:type III effector protein n=1 Tax=Streptomyces tauricus TaxID=68274 RepID=UPI002243CBE5|nr:type III effector protein [Streptomyces tauricus]MCW8103285.1 type III effector protein [Streptomyces tauricus]